MDAPTPHNLTAPVDSGLVPRTVQPVRALVSCAQDTSAFVAAGRRQAVSSANHHRPRPGWRGWRC